MSGWMISFAVIALVGGILLIAGYPAESAIKMASIVFAFLFALGLLTRAVRGRTG